VNKLDSSHVWGKSYGHAACVVWNSPYSHTCDCRTTTKDRSHVWESFRFTHAIFSGRVAGPYR
jgi:hypothetical protein